MAAATFTLFNAPRVSIVDPIAPFHGAHAGAQAWAESFRPPPARDEIAAVPPAPQETAAEPYVPTTGASAPGRAMDAGTTTEEMS